MRIIGLMGRIGSGKGTVGEVLVKEYGFNSITMGDLAREETINRGLEPTREETTRISTECRMNDPAYFIKKAVSKIKESGHDKWVIDGIRTPLDVKEFKQSFPEIKFIKVEVLPQIRYERMKLRGRAGFPDSFNKFIEHEALEEERFNLKSTLSNADYTIENNGSYEELVNKTRELVNKLF
ncbi:MAG: nucleoside monophosphate kinase [Candidatus Nanoarchaeia archaeon]|jgi:dephospho-CoA kinase